MNHRDDELKELIGQPYTKENSRKMIYGGRVDSKGIIVAVHTSKDYKKIKTIWKPDWWTLSLLLIGFSIGWFAHMIFVGVR